ncbi:MAG: glutathione S-transferase [Gaiellaceae bacterium]|nr:glutathione S-transferase [Gaiellaceae bacterium]
MKALLLGIPASHPSLTAELMLRHKGVEYERIDLAPGLHRLLLRAAGFEGITVPAIVTRGQHLQGTLTISRALDVLEPAAPPLFPRDAERRREVERAELWGDLVLQPAARRLVWAALKRDRSTIASFFEGARTGIPIGLAVAIAPPFARFAAYANRATDRSARRDLAALPQMLDSVDALVERGVVGGPEPNAADYQLATSVRLLMALDDLRPVIEGRAAGRLARERVPDFPGRLPRVFPPEWLSVRPGP